MIGSVGWLVPGRFHQVLRVHPPAPASADGDWWPSYRNLFEVLASVGKRHTSTPDRAWLGIWDGHGFDKGATYVVSRGPLDEQARADLADQQRQLWDADRRRHDAVRAALGSLLTFDRPERSYHLLSAQVDSVTDLRHPGDAGWRNPDLFWPDDRSWFVGTDVDFWSLYVGGTAEFLREVAANVPTRCERVSRAAALESED